MLSSPLTPTIVPETETLPETDTGIGTVVIDRPGTAETDFGDMWRVLIHNDPITTFEYVIYILVDLFLLSTELAEHIAFTAHEKGEAVVVIRPKAEAQRLAKVAEGRARTDGYPLSFSIERD